MTETKEKTDKVEETAEVRDQITKVKFEKKKTTIGFTSIREIAGDLSILNWEVTTTYQQHEDFIGAMRALRNHAIDIAELIKGLRVARVLITGIHLTGMDDDETAKVCITAIITNQDGKNWNLVTPKTTLFDEKKYSGAANLDKKCKAIIEYAWAHIDGKHGETQQSIEFTDKEGSEAKVINMNVTIQSGAKKDDDDELLL